MMRQTCDLMTRTDSHSDGSLNLASFDCMIIFSARSFSFTGTSSSM